MKISFMKGGFRSNLVLYISVINNCRFEEELSFDYDAKPISKYVLLTYSLSVLNVFRPFILRDE